MGSTPDIPSQLVHKKLQRSQSFSLSDGETKSSDKQLNDEIQNSDNSDKIEERAACEMCRNYEIQLQDMQYNESVLGLQIENSNKLIKQLRDELKKEQTFRSDLEEKFNEDAKKADREIRDLCTRLDDSQKNVNLLNISHNELRKEANDIISNLMNQTEELNKELQRIARDNDTLLGKYIAKSQVLQSEAIDLPQDIDEMQFYSLKLREELITTLVAKERSEETLKSEILFLKEQIIGEQQTKERIEENLTQDNDLLRSTVDSLQMELNDVKGRYEEDEQTMKHCTDQFNSLSHSSEQKISELQAQLNEITAAKAKLETEMSQLRNKVQSLQVELDNSEAVQRDFVKLSQSLQIQLEKIRQSDSEVRWQHDDDAIDCNSCRKSFHSRKEKTHCNHCGRVFCSECNNKVIHSGPKGRPFKVCNVCHTLLDNQTACWFVNEAPQSPT